MAISLTEAIKYRESVSDTWKPIVIGLPAPDEARIYVGADTPIDPNINIWLDLDDIDPGQSIVKSVNGLTGNVIIPSGVTSINNLTGAVTISLGTLGGMPQWKLLWTNAAPTSTFNAQTISLDLTLYDAAIVLTRAATSVLYSDTTLIFKNELGVSNIKLSTSAALNGRTMDMNNNGIVFGQGYQSSTASGNYAVPLRIFGIRGILLE